MTPRIIVLDHLGEEPKLRYDWVSELAVWATVDRAGELVLLCIVKPGSEQRSPREFPAVSELIEASS